MTKREKKKKNWLPYKLFFW